MPDQLRFFQVPPSADVAFRAGAPVNARRGSESWPVLSDENSPPTPSCQVECNDIGTAKTPMDAILRNALPRTTARASSMSGTVLVARGMVALLFPRRDE